MTDEEIIEALRPFANFIARNQTPKVHWDFPMVQHESGKVTIADFLRAAEALAALEARKPSASPYLSQLVTMLEEPSDPAHFTTDDAAIDNFELRKEAAQAILTLQLR